MIMMYGDDIVQEMKYLCIITHKALILLSKCQGLVYWLEVKLHIILFSSWTNPTILQHSRHYPLCLPSPKICIQFINFGLHNSINHSCQVPIIRIIFRKSRRKIRGQTLYTYIYIYLVMFKHFISSLLQGWSHQILFCFKQPGFQNYSFDVFKASQLV